MSPQITESQWRYEILTPKKSFSFPRDTERGILNFEHATESFWFCFAGVKQLWMTSLTTRVKEKLSKS